MAALVKIAIRRNAKSPDLKVNDKQLQTANLVYIYIFDDIILNVKASKYGIAHKLLLITFIEGR